MGERVEQTLHQRKYMNGKQAHERHSNPGSPVKWKLNPQCDTCLREGLTFTTQIVPGAGADVE